jgi:hypothetical protein
MCRGNLLEGAAAAAAGSGLTAFFDTDLLGLGAFDLTTCREALIAKNTQGFHFRTLTAAFAVLEYFEIAWTGHTIFVDRLFAFWHGPPEHQEFADVLNGSRIEFIGQSLKHGFPRCAVIRKYANLDQSMSVQGSVSFLFDGGGEPVTTHHHDRVEVMGFGAVFFTLGRGQLNLGHAGIIGHEGKNESQNQRQQSQSGVDKRSRQ